MPADLAWRLHRDGYAAVDLDRRARRGGPTYVTRLLGRRAVVLGDLGGLDLFYDESLVRRRDAVPPPLAWLLFGRGALHARDGEPHRERKERVLGWLDPASTAAIAREVGDGLADALDGVRTREVDLHPLLVRLLGPAVIAWAGIEVDAHVARRMSAELARVVDGFGFAGLAYPRAWVARVRTDRWMRGLLREVREGRRTPPSGSLLAEVAGAGWPEDLRGSAVMLGNVLRPTVAVAWLAAAAVEEVARSDAGTRRRLVEDPARRAAFAEAVRRGAPFVPVLAGRARRWTRVGDGRSGPLGIAVRPGDLLVLDVHGLDHRDVAGSDGCPVSVPQGGGPATGHRCPGESLTAQVLGEVVRVAAAADVRPAGDPGDPGEARGSVLEASPRRIPPRPAARVRVG